MSFRINRVYTRSGDLGETSLVGGQRVSKSSKRVTAYGDIDELNSWLGHVRCLVSNESEIAAVLDYLQQELFDVGAEVATLPQDIPPDMWQVKREQIVYLENLCDHFGSGLEELKSFLIPGGAPLLSFLHIARTVTRRAERSAVALYEENKDLLNPFVIKYLNRLSDLLFILARWVIKHESLEPVLWQKAGSRAMPNQGK